MVPAGRPPLDPRLYHEGLGLTGHSVGRYCAIPNIFRNLHLSRDIQFPHGTVMT